jgi:guanosine-3',5'-bis(diphosphate) 3'-pyrophosphohydrolase
LHRSFDFQVNHDLAATNQEFEAQVHNTFPASAANRITKGLEIATNAHLGQLRSDGGPYIVHPIRTALLAIRYDSLRTPELVIACLLHDTLEDTKLTERAVAEEFGPVVTKYVVSVTRYRPADETAQQRFESKSANWQRIMNSGPEVRSIKTFDYCDNMITWKFIKPDMPGYKKIPRWLKEAQDLYLPLARITNPEAVRLLEREIEGYLSAGHKMGDRLGP